MKIFDALIIGGGPAGLSTALGLGRVNRSCVVFSHDVFRNDGIEASHAVLGHDHIHPQEIWARGRDQIKRYNNTIFQQAEIVSAAKTKLPGFENHTGFVVTDESGQSWKGRTLMMATGVKDIFPDLPGYAENWPRNIYQCPFCDGWERRSRRKGILCYPSFNPMAVKMVSMFANMEGDDRGEKSPKVTLLTNGDPNPNNEESIAKVLQICQARGCEIETRKVVKLVNTDGRSEGVDVHLRDENGNEESVHFGFLSHKPATAPRADELIEQLQLEKVAGTFGENIKANGPFQSTNIPGIFVAGDTGNAMTHVSTAIMTGVGGAAGIAHTLNDQDDEIALERYLESSSQAADVIAQVPDDGVQAEICAQA